MSCEFFLNLFGNLSIGESYDDVSASASVMELILFDKGVKSFLETNPSIVNLNLCGFTPLYIATLCRNLQAVADLIHAGADVNSPVSGTTLPLHYANSVDLAKLLVTPENINSVDNEGRTLLFLAFIRGNTDLVEFLLTNGADKKQVLDWMHVKEIDILKYMKDYE